MVTNTTAPPPLTPIRDIREGQPAATPLAETLAAILRTAPDHDTCVDALREAAWAADEAAFVGTDHRATCTWVSTGAFRAFVSRTGAQRTLWSVAAGAAVQLVALDQAVQA